MEFSLELNLFFGLSSVDSGKIKTSASPQKKPESLNEINFGVNFLYRGIKIATPSIALEHDIAIYSIIKFDKWATYR